MKLYINSFSASVLAVVLTMVLTYAFKLLLLLSVHSLLVMRYQFVVMKL